MLDRFKMNKRIGQPSSIIASELLDLDLSLEVEESLNQRIYLAILSHDNDMRVDNNLTNTFSSSLRS